jgi:hypothetical protein
MSDLIEREVKTCANYRTVFAAAVSATATLKATVHSSSLDPDMRGGSWHYFYLAGSPTTSPTAGILCPNCKQTDVGNQLVDRRRLLLENDD